MIDRLLVIITRMYAKKGGDNDEFTRFWATAEQSEFPHLLFKNITNQERRYVLVIHGHGYPDRVDKSLIERACHSITAGFSAIEPTEDKRSLLVGLVFHPHPSWIETDIMSLNQGLQDCLEAIGVSVEFIEIFAGGGVLERMLAPQCRTAGSDFAAAFDRGWSSSSSKIEADSSSSRPANAESEQDVVTAVDLSDYARQLGFLKHELTHLLQPIDIDLQGWEQSDFPPDYGREILACHRNNKAHSSLLAARRLVQGRAPDNRVSVRTIIEEAGKRAGGLAQAVEEKWTRLNELFESEDFKKAETLLEALGEESDATDDASSPPQTSQEKRGTEEILARLREKLKAGNDFHLWYVDLETRLNELRQLLS